MPTLSKDSSTPYSITILCSGLDSSHIRQRDFTWILYRNGTEIGRQTNSLAAGGTEQSCSFYGLNPNTAYKIKCSIYDTPEFDSQLLWVGEISTSTDPLPPSFSCTITPTSYSTASVSASFTNGQATNFRRFIRVSIDGRQIDIDAAEVGGTDNTFFGSITGLTANTTYSWTCTLGYRNADDSKHLSSYTDSGSFTTPQAKGIWIYGLKGTARDWYHATPYIYGTKGNVTKWYPATAYIYANGTWNQL